MKRPHPYRILCLLPNRTRFHRVSKGIHDYAKEFGLNLLYSSFINWSDVLIETQGLIDGMVVEGRDPNGPQDIINQTSIKVIGLYHGSNLGTLPRVISNVEATAKIVFDHFQKLEIASFAAFYNLHPEEPEFRIRGKAFLQLVKDNQKKPYLFPNGPRMATGWTLARQIDDLGDWLTSLPQPIGLFAGDDEHAQRAIFAATKYGLSIPQDLIILGFGNDPLVCEACQPSLSSVDPDWEKMGWEAGHQLHEMLKGNAPSPRVIKVPPKGIARRESTDHRYADSPIVRKIIVDFERDMTQKIALQDIASNLSISHTSLNQMFRKATGNSMCEYFRRRRLEKSVHLLKTTSLDLAEICSEVGISWPSQLCKDLKKMTGQTPKQIRQEIEPIVFTSSPKRLET